MDITEVDHYVVLDLPSGEQGAKLSQQEISKAYRKKALELHPDKRPDDPNAHENFRKLKTSYDFLKDEKNRKLFDSTRLRYQISILRQEQRQRQESVLLLLNVMISSKRRNKDWLGLLRIMLKEWLVENTKKLDENLTMEGLEFVQCVM
ncbi:hypothetical protein KY290_022442 [Solanum tuberosum]|uniref:J domain-containing protein n=1 Tax=Solanum tuberosum TaxID=4113 RepID=A0ABQ7V5Z2_SOLTU|nr:hypothetical protein KY290_022442 [Solanum tuberosum]